MTYYATLNTSDVADMSTLMTYANRVSDNLFLPLMLLVVWSIWVLGSTFIGKSISRAVLFASFLCSILSILFVLMNWLSPNYMYFLFLLTALGLLWVRLSESYS
jgi:Flp pilus assembly protein TadB